MATITKSNPLMAPIAFDGNTYYTAQYFHQMYRANSDMNGKYKRAGDFMRLIRSIPTYQDYIDARDIVEIRSKADIPEGPETQNLRLAHKSNNYAAIMLINATAQVALTHHLDDAVSRKASVAVNRKVATEGTKVIAGDVETAKELISFFNELGAMIGTEQQMTNAVAVTEIQRLTGINAQPLLAASNSVEEVPVTPTDLGKEIGVSARSMNQMLLQAGLQYRDEHDNWMPTPAGKEYCTLNPYKSAHSEHSGYRILWRKTVLDQLTQAA